MSSRSTVFLVPGLTGTQLRDCITGQLLWLNPQLMLDCPSSLMEYLDLHYDAATKSFKSTRGIATAGDVGDLTSIRVITEPPLCAGGQFDQFVRFLEAIGGYNAGKDLFGVPYDWRLILDPTYWRALSSAFREHVEKNSGGCSNTRAILIGFSLGGLVLTRFLREQTPEWRERYIKRVIFVGVPLGGCPKSFISVCGTIEDLPGYNTPCVRRFLQRCSGAFMCSPIPAAFPGLKIIKDIFDTETGTIKSFGVDELLEAYTHPRFNTQSARQIYSDYGDLINNLTSQGIAEDIDLHIVYSSVKDTTIGLDYKGGCQGHKVRESDYYKQLAKKEPRKTRKSCSIIVGDGIVPHVSLSFWDKKAYPSGKPYATSVKCFVGYQYDHAEMFNRIDIIQHIYDLLELSCMDHRLEPLIVPGSLLA